MLALRFIDFFGANRIQLCIMALALTIGAGFISILGTTMAGSMSDRFGRRSVIAATVLATAISFALFYACATVGAWCLGPTLTRCYALET